MPEDTDCYMHKHKCPKCDTVWQHSYKARGRLEYHKCPECGLEQWDLYEGDKAACVTQTVTRRKGGGNPPPECA